MLALLATAAPAQERKRLDMPAGMQGFAASPKTESTSPPGISRMLQNGEPADPRVIASSAEATSTTLPRVDFYNNLSRGTLGQMRDGIAPTLPSGELRGENRWAMPPSVGVVVQGRLGESGGTSVGFNAGPGVQQDGTTGGVAINARVRVPFGR